MNPIEHVLIVANPEKPNVGRVLADCERELDSRGIRYARNTPGRFKIQDSDTLTDLAADFRWRNYSLILSVGGDGTFLYTARTFHPFGIPLAGVHAGKLGFLNEIAPDRIGHALDGVQSGRAKLSRRILLTATVVRGGRERYRFQFLNDVVISKGALSRMVEFSLSMNGEEFSRYRADGLIVSTPTGSTAYNLAAGGPILTQGMEAMIITPICPHLLGLRPIVTSEDQDFSILMVSDEEETTLTVDGQENCRLRRDDEIRITRTGASVGVYDFGEYRYFTLLRTKLGWPL